MTTAEWIEQDEELSLFAVGAALLKKRWMLLRYTLLGGVLAILPVLTAAPVYRATASFVPEGFDPSRSSLASLAGQLGVSVPGTNQALSPEFYLSLVRSRVLLQPIVRDSFVVQERGGRRIAFYDLFEIEEATPLVREERGFQVLSRVVVPTLVKSTGVVEISATTEWRSVSLAIVGALLEAVNDYNQRTRQGQAAAERKFVEARLADASRDLRQAEERLGYFLRTNMDVGRSPTLILERDRIQREVGFKQQVAATLTQAYEEVRIREVRDTPVITVFESPYASARPEPRGRAKRALLGAMLGALAGAVVALASAMLGKKREGGSSAASEFMVALEETKRDIAKPNRWAKRFVGR